jgi:hypothetical protein
MSDGYAKSPWAPGRPCEAIAFADPHVSAQMRCGDIVDQDVAYVALWEVNRQPYVRDSQLAMSQDAAVVSR